MPLNRSCFSRFSKTESASSSFTSLSVPISFRLKPRGLRRKEIGTLSEVKEELADSVFENLEKQDLFNGNFIHILEFLKKIKLIYDE